MVNNSIWDNLSKEVETGTGSGDIPEIPNDLYNATIVEASEPVDKEDIFNPGKMKTQFYLSWRLDSDDFEEDVTRRQYLTLPAGYLNSGFLHHKSDLFKVMEALGFDMTGRYRVDPRTWVGMTARVMIENKENGKGEMVPRITGVQPPRRKKDTAQKREPVGAGAAPAARPPLRERLQDADDED